MSQECAMILLDNSDWARNGDQHPTRWEAQTEAAQLIANNKLQINIENSVGAILMAGKQVEVLLTPCNDITKFLGVLHGIQLRGSINLKNSIAIASLALKHRQNKNAKQRIFVFVASPVAEDEKTLTDLGKKLKKNNIAIDLINIGIMEPAHISKLQKFIDTVNNQGNSHFQNVEPSVQLLSDQLLGTAIISESVPQDIQGMQAEGQGGAPNPFQGGVDPNLDPELAMALRISLEEEKERQKKKDEENKPANQQQQPAQQQQGQNQQPQPQQPQENQQKSQAIQVEAPQQQQQNSNKMEDEKQNAEQSKPKNQQPAAQMEEEEIDEEELMRRAKELSLVDNGNESKAIEQQVLQDPDFVKSLLKDFDIDANNPDIKNILDQNEKKDQEGGNKDKDNKDKNQKQ